MVAECQVPSAECRVERSVQELRPGARCGPCPARGTGTCKHSEASVLDVHSEKNKGNYWLFNIHSLFIYLFVYLLNYLFTYLFT